ncbi:glycosyltransferase [Leptothermofonsia sichuanensis E412]|uniref:glycosyltransferase n=1 Tax=Leptothermofonsia sichuanensis TaxID=2917832 RepID=UPI001CA723AE|nr:glycosyltransferase [Leptothermofonsia sichuanensis]QZZ21654.1 glycosyltransferase [Leptothermofonsia sichuanensis E412]
MFLVFEILFTVLIIGSIAFYFACAFFTYQFFSNPRNQGEPLALQGTDSLAPPFSPSLPHPPISLLIPACGIDAGAWDNWTSLCTQTYPNYEVLFGVTDPQDPCIPVIKNLMVAYPERVRLYEGLEPRGFNYKDSNLSYLLEKANHDLIVFADSDIRVHSDYLHTVTAPLADERVGMVTCAFIGYEPQYVGAAIASLGRCVDFIPSLLIARSLDGGLRCAVGATIATRRSALDAYGGLHMNRIGSDYNIGKRAVEAGYRVELSPYVLDSDTGTETVQQVFQRELRWSRTIRFNRGAQYYTMVFCFGTVYCLPLLLVSGFAGWAIALTLLTFTIRYLQALVAISSIGALKLMGWLWLLPFRDLLSFASWVMGAFGRGVYWRGRRLRIEGDGLITQW